MECLCRVLPVSVRTASPQRYFRAKSPVTLTSRAAPQSEDCVRARPFRVPGLFASCVPLRGRCGARLARAVCGSRRTSTPPPRSLLAPWRAIHPRMRLAWLGRRASRRPATPPRGVCRATAAVALWPRGRHASPLARYSQSVGASVAACTSCSVPSQRLARTWLIRSASARRTQAERTRGEAGGERDARRGGGISAREAADRQRRSRADRQLSSRRTSRLAGRVPRTTRPTRAQRSAQLSSPSR